MDIRVAVTGQGWRATVRLTAIFGALGLFISMAAPSAAGEMATDWVEGHNVRTRLLIGAKDAGTQQKGNLVAGLEMELGEGWKTYWRTPGDAGGVPPEFDWSGSQNVAAVDMRYPAPRRMTDRAGSTIGYKKHVVFPAIVRLEKPDQPVTLKLQLTFGVCREICVPSESSFEIEVPAGESTPSPAVLAEAMERIPVAQNGSLDGGAPSEALNAPRLANTIAMIDGATPKLTMHVNFPKGTAGADVFVEGPPGEFVPLPKKVGSVDDKTLIFEIDLTKGADVAALKGKSLKATMVSDSASSEQTLELK